MLEVCKNSVLQYGVCYLVFIPVFFDKSSVCEVPKYVCECAIGDLS